jgi:exopolysaccharide biosynthesis polyprenyl glycosylphosphotransferase
VRGDLVLAAALLALVAGTLRCGMGLVLATRPVRVLVAGHRGAVARTLGELDGPHLDVVATCLAGPRGVARQDALVSPPGIAVGAGFSSIPAMVREHEVELVVVLPCHHVRAEVLRRLSWQLAETGTQLLTGPGLNDVTVSRLVGRQVGPLCFTQVHHPTLRGTSRVAKVVTERVLAALLLVISAPALGLLAVLVRLESTGPALFRQVRIGRDGKPFTMLKLRTMVVRPPELPDGVNDTDGCLFKLRQDPRVTRVGAWLRRLSLDELPQLVNVVRGEMALVGPRPPLPEEVQRYDDDARRRLVVTPGLTGLWQVSGRSDLSWADTVRLDVRYVDNWSLALDARILALTVRAVLGRRGAY